ncbi:hypothetical protein JQC92_13475 [Shewanella sp. 202IG2-18]|uniref:hypothetical protein n=1 Tax=Parashewanella hymeniacidonis TaxID=2807618 RepID=UPI001961FF75|nr:hypothetical protein [Parashewanella hymeniacidonis]MBM7073027.1 hypothetical protein [Parashewanella hymeniacidonis]
MFEFGLIALSVLSCILLGSNAYHSGMPVRRWGVAGLVLGPFAVSIHQRGIDNLKLPFIGIYNYKLAIVL